MPLAYFITFTTYGVWLHGRETGSIDKKHNEPGSPFLPPDPIRETQMLQNMRDAPYLLDERRRAIVLDTIVKSLPTAAGICTPAMFAPIMCTWS